MSPPTVSYSSSSSSPSVDVEQLARGRRRGPAVDPGLVVGEPDDQRLLLVVLVLDLADDLLEQVLDRDQAGRAAVLVEHDREVDLAPLELVEQVVDASSIRARRPASAGSSAAPAARSTVPLRNGSRSLA